MTADSEPPVYIRDAAALLERAYPSGIPDGDLPCVMAVLRDADFSERSAAAVLAARLGGSYVDFVYHVRVCELDETVTPITKDLVRQRLCEHGFDELLARLG